MRGHAREDCKVATDIDMLHSSPPGRIPFANLLGNAEGYRLPQRASIMAFPQAGPSSPKLPIVDTRKKGIYTAASCPYCKTEIEYLKPTAPVDAIDGKATFQLRCASCKETWNGPVYRDPSKKTAGGGRAGRTIGTGQWITLISHQWPSTTCQRR